MAEHDTVAYWGAVSRIRTEGQSTGRVSLRTPPIREVPTLQRYGLNL